MNDHNIESGVSSLLKKPERKSKAKNLKICNVANKPILSPDIEKEVHGVVSQFLGMNQWYEWGMKNYRKQGPLVVLEGPSGTGKTTIARYLTQLIKRPLAPLDLGVFGSSAPGEGERNITHFFAEAEHNHATVFLDEADGFLWDRSLAGGDSMWMVSIINKTLVELADYRGLAIIATNRFDVLDKALKSRTLATIAVGRPDYQTRVRLWQAKVPKKYPLQLSTVQCEELAQYDLTGRTIENAVVKEAQNAVLEGRTPQFISLCNVAKTFQHQ